MKIMVKAKPGKRQSAVRKREDGWYEVEIDAEPVNNRANDRLIEILANHFHIAKSNLRIVSGFTGKTKIIEVSTL